MASLPLVPMPIDSIMPMHIRQYMEICGEVGKVRANREKALFSHIFSKAREWGYTSAQNPCQGVRGFRQTGRTRYVTDAEFDLVKAHAHFTVVDAMDLTLLTGQRPADVLKIKCVDFRDGALWIVQTRLAHDWESRLPGSWRSSSQESANDRGGP